MATILPDNFKNRKQKVKVIEIKKHHRELIETLKLTSDKGKNGADYSI